MIDFIGKAKGLTKNPLGIIALFISLIYGFACLVLSTSINNLKGPEERLPLIWFIILFPLLILVAFTYLVVNHHRKLYAPSDYKDEKNFVNTYVGNKDIPADLDKLIKKLKLTSPDQLEKQLGETIKEIEIIKEKSENIPINNLWWLNHWGSNCATIIADKMVFTGTSAPDGKDGSHIDLNNLLEVGKTYEISCFAKSDENTDGMFQLWCHDNTGVVPYGSDTSTPFRIPAVEGEKISLFFRAIYNKNIRVHLQYLPGKGRIIISDVKINEAQI